MRNEPHITTMCWHCERDHKLTFDFVQVAHLVSLRTDNLLDALPADLEPYCRLSLGLPSGDKVDDPLAAGGPYLEML